MNGEVCVYIPVAEYRELVREQVVAELLRKALADKCSLEYSEIALLQTMFGGREG